MNAHELYREGRLQDAVTAALDDVKKHPTDPAKRMFLAELCCFAGDLERADRQLDVLADPNKPELMGALLFRQLIRAEMARQEFYAQGHVPEFLAEPTAAVRLALEASIAAREGNAAEAARLAGEAEAVRAKPHGTCDGKAFDDLRDLDDLIAPVFEVLTSNGKYYWVASDTVELIEFRKPERSRDLIWRRAHMIVSDGPDGEVYVPVLYPGTAKSADDGLRLARKTEWLQPGPRFARGLGAREFLVGDDARNILEMTTITFEKNG